MSQRLKKEALRVEYTLNAEKRKGFTNHGLGGAKVFRCAGHIPYRMKKFPRISILGGYESFIPLFLKWTLVFPYDERNREEIDANIINHSQEGY